MSRNQIFVLISGALLVLCALIVLMAGIIFMIFRAGDQPPFVPQTVTVLPQPRPSAHGNSMGDPDAPIQIEEFSDFQCPYCQHFHEETEPLLMEQYVSTGKVYFTYRSMGNFVSDNLARALADPAKTESQDAALAAYCAGDQDLFWEMHDYLFANVLGEDVGSFTDGRIKRIAEQAGMDMDQFNRCFDSGSYESRVRQDFEDGQAAGVEGVPSFLLTYTANGQTKTRLILGSQPFSFFQHELESVLEEIGAQ